jgi:hypothetical protein
MKQPITAAADQLTLLVPFGLNAIHMKRSVPTPNSSVPL